MMQSCESSDSCFSRCFINQASASDPEGVSVWHSITRTLALCFTTCCETEGERTPQNTPVQPVHVSRLHTLLLLILFSSSPIFTACHSNASSPPPGILSKPPASMLHIKSRGNKSRTTRKHPETLGGCCAYMLCRNDAFKCNNING